MIIFIPVFITSCIGYAIYSGVTAERQSKKNEVYRNKVIKHTIKGGHPISNDYKHLEGQNERLLVNV